MKIQEIIESATAGATSAANIGTVVNPHISPGKARGKTSYLGKPGGPEGLNHLHNPRLYSLKTRTAQLKTP